MQTLLAGSHFNPLQQCVPKGSVPSLLHSCPLRAHRCTCSQFHRCRFSILLSWPSDARPRASLLLWVRAISRFGNELLRKERIDEGAVSSQRQLRFERATWSLAMFVRSLAAFTVGMWKRLTASNLEDGIATSICTVKWKRKRKRKRWKRHENRPLPHF